MVLNGGVASIQAHGILVNYSRRLNLWTGLILKQLVLQKISFFTCLNFHILTSALDFRGSPPLHSKNIEDNIDEHFLC